MKYIVEFTQRTYDNLDDARARAYRIVMYNLFGTRQALIYDANSGKSIGSVSYWKAGYKPKWHDFKNKAAYHVVEESGTITRM